MHEKKGISFEQAESVNYQLNSEDKKNIVESVSESEVKSINISKKFLILDSLGATNGNETINQIHKQTILDRI